MRLIRKGLAAPDPNDEMVLEAAINGQADALVTYNVADFAGIAERFRIEVMHPADLLKRVKIKVKS
jgi:predicted nucleic acid-binding protein